VKLASLGTDKAREAEIIRRLDKLDEVVEKAARKHYTEQIKKLFEKYLPERKPGEKPKGKLDPDVQELVDAAEAAMDLDGIKTDERLAGIDARLAGDLTPEQEIQAERERALVELFGDWKHADAARMSAALDAIRDTASEGWAKWKLKQILKREEREALRKALRQDTGKKGTSGERDKALVENANVIGRSVSRFLNLSSFHEVLRYVFGANSKTATALGDSEREASNQYEDAIQATGDEVQDFFTQMTGSALKGERLRFDLSRPTLKVGERTLSPLQGVQALLMWQQDDGRRHMEGPLDENGQPMPDKWHYDQAWIDVLTAALPAEALSVKAFLESMYGREYGPLNALYRTRHGVNLPHHANYAPLTVKPQQAKAGEMVDPVSGNAITGSILTPGALRSRSRVAQAEPDFRDALATFIAHNKQMEHWKAYFDFAVEAQAILGNREVANSIEAAVGKEGVTVLRKWVDLFAQGGARDAAAGLAVTDIMRRLASNAATVALLGRVSTLLVQSTQLAAASVKMPVGAYLKRFGMLMSGNLEWGDAMRSEFIQRRIASAPPIVRQALENLGQSKRPGQISRAVRFLGNLLSGADGLFTAGTYAILLDYHRSLGEKMGMAGAELDAHAHREAERDTESVAQPVRMGARSILEVTVTNPMARMMWAYSSESRQKIALFGWALGNAKKAPETLFKTAFLTFVVGGLGAQILKNLWREAKGDDDEDKWGPERLAVGMLTQPLRGIPLMAELMGESGIFSGLSWSKAAFNRLAEDDYESETDRLRDIDTLISAAGYFNDTAAGIAALSHVGLDLAKLLENVIVDGEGN